MTTSTLVERRRVSARLALLSFTTALCTGLAAPALAQLAAPAPVRQSIDTNGVDLFNGTLKLQGPTLSIGGKDQQLGYTRVWRNGNWSDTAVASLQLSGTTLTVSLGDSSDSFELVDGSYVSTQKAGSTLTLENDVYTYRQADGTEATFDRNKSSTVPYYANEGRVTSIKRPSGERLTYTYNSVAYCHDTTAVESCPPPGYATAYRITSVRSSFGYTLSFGYRSNNSYGAVDVVNWSMVTSVKAVNQAIEYCAPSAAPCATTGSWPTQGFGSDNNYSTGTYVDVITDAIGRQTRYRRASNGEMVGVTSPGSTSEDITIGYANGRVSSITTPTGAWSYAASDGANGVRTVTVTDPSSASTAYLFDIATSLMRSMTDAQGHVSAWDYDASGRVVLTTTPEGGSVGYGYDARGNVTSAVRHPKPGSGQADIASSAAYPSVCDNALTCNQPTSTTDANGNTTEYTYDTTHGGVLTVTSPAPSPDAVRPQVRYGYTPMHAYYKDASGSIVASGQTVYRLTGVSTCQNKAGCADPTSPDYKPADEVRASVDYGPQSVGTANNLFPVASTTAPGDSSVSATTRYSYDAVGNLTAVDGPLAGTGDTSNYSYDGARQLVQVTGPDPDGIGTGRPSRAVKYDRNLDGLVTTQTTGTANADGSGFNGLQTVSTTYDAAGRKRTETVAAGGKPYGLTQYSYNDANRVTCAAVRMDSTAWGNLPSDACTLPQIAGPAGNDRITRVQSDEVGRRQKVTSAYGTADAADDVSLSYTPDGKVATATDAKGNVTAYGYDGYDRDWRTCFQTSTATACAASSPPADYEELTPDANGNITRRRLRDGQIIGYAYDALNRLTSKDLPGNESDVTYSYDLLGRLTGASQPGNVLSFTYDALGRNLDQTGPLGTSSSQYDAAGRRTRLTWPDQFYVTYDYYDTGDMKTIRELGTTSGPGVLATFSYDDLGSRTSLTRGNGTVVTYTPDALSRLSALHDLAGTAKELTLGLEYNAARQIASATRSDAYAWKGQNQNLAYSVNGLNQVIVAGGTTIGYDARGNLTNWGSKAYSYSSENLLTGGSAGASLAYDPLMRLYGVTQGGTTRFAYDGTDLIAEYDSAGALQRRYIHGPGADEPLVWYEGSGTGNKRYLHADERGSVVAVTDNSGNAIAINTYDEYGIPGANNLGRFQYTGQKWIPGLGLYDYKARMYSPQLGRFLQTDPIGYGDGMDWYNYVGSDPVNGTDATGLCLLDACSGGSGSGPLPGEITVTARYYPLPGEITVTARYYPLPGEITVTARYYPLPGEITVTARYYPPSFLGVSSSIGSPGARLGPDPASLLGVELSKLRPGAAHAPAPQNPKPCASAGDSIGSTVVDRVGDAHGSIFAAGAASASKAGNASGAQAIGRAALPGAVALGALSEGIGAAHDYSGGMSAGRSAAIHGTGFAGGLLGGFLLGEAVEPLGGGIVGALVAGIAGSYGGSKAGESLGAAGATAVGVCR